MHSFHLVCSASNWYRNNMDSKPQSKRRTCVYTCAYTQSASGADRSSDSSGPAGVWRATTRSEEPAGCRGLGLGCGSQTLLQILSLSLCCPPWLRAAGQQSRFLCVFLHWRRQRLPTHINTVAPEGSWLSFHHCELPGFFFCFFFFCFYFHVCEAVVWVQHVTKGEKMKSWYWFYMALVAMILTFKSFCIHCWTNCFFLHEWSRVITVIVLIW